MRAIALQVVDEQSKVVVAMLLDILQMRRREVLDVGSHWRAVARRRFRSLWSRRGLFDLCARTCRAGASQDAGNGVMSVLTEVLQELWSMFVGDRRLTLLLLAVVAAATALSAFLPALHGAATALR